MTELNITTDGNDSGESSFPITLHPPLLPTLTHHTPTITEGDGSASPPTRHVIGHIPDPSLGPILIPAVPPYSHSQSNGIESEQGGNEQFPAQISSVHNI